MHENYAIVGQSAVIIEVLIDLFSLFVVVQTPLLLKIAIGGSISIDVLANTLTIVTQSNTMLLTLIDSILLFPLIFWAATLFAVLIERGKCHIIVTTRGIDTSTLWSIIANLSVESKYCIKLLLE